MKLLLIVSLLISTSFASVVFPDMPVEKCETTCHHVGYTFSSHGRFDMCQDIQSCDVLEWNDDINACELVKTETRKYPMNCRDIPPVTF